MTEDDIIGMSYDEVEDNLLNLLENLKEYIENRTLPDDNFVILNMLTEGLESINEVFNNNWEAVLL